jgi:membrane protease YdiL (CAAX protease family)
VSGLEFPERPAGAPERRPGADRPWSGWWAIPIAIGAVLVATLVYVLAAVLHDAVVDNPAHQAGNVGIALHGTPPVLTFASTLAQGLALVGGSLLAAGSALKGRLTAAHLGLRAAARPYAAVGWVVAGYVTFILISAAWLTITHIQDRENIPIQLGTRDSAAALVLAALLTCVIAPVCEELFFRGFLFGALRKHGLVVAALVSGIAFGLAHVASAPIGFLVPLGALGVILALVYERTGSLYPSMGLHALNNSIAFGIGDGRAWLIPVGLVAAGAAVWALARAARGGRPWRTVVPNP